MLTDTAPADAQAREQLRSDLDSTLFVDAGAGTGKTTAIVGRIVELVARDRIQMAELVAITFTEAAAAELRARIREALQKAADDLGRPDGERARCRRAGTEIGQASIDTIHAFAGDLLRTYPLNAGLPPGFSVLDPIEADLGFEERFRAWFDGAATAPHREAVRLAFLLGLTPDNLRKLAEGMHANYELLTPTTAWPAPPPPRAVDAAHAAGYEMAEAINLLQHAPAGHPALKIVGSRALTAQRLRAARTESEALSALLRMRKLSHQGTQDGWTPIAGKNAFARIKDHTKAAVAIANEALGAHRASVLAELLPALRDFVLDYAEERRRSGTATFGDLLVWARDLVRDDADVRLAVQKRWKRVFIDEFQDTDPLQAEIAFHLCARAGDPAPGDWTRTVLEQGKLCLVGDPKQSIYRFRRADIALYQRVRELVAEPLVLSRNFRSVPAVIEFANRHFERVMSQVEGRQPAYQPLAASREDAGPAVHRFGGMVPGNAAEAWAAEADAVARSIRRMVDEGWTVLDRDTGEPAAVSYRDICVLIPSRTNLRRLERELEARDIEYRVESGEILLATQEVRDLLSALRAIDDPSDEVALVAALRSPIYGCSDPELALWRARGGRFDHLSLSDGQVPRVAAALEHLKALHVARTGVTVAALVQKFIDERMLVAAGFGQHRPRETWRRYRYAAARARAFAATGRTTLREFVEWMEGLTRNQARDVSGSITESDEDAVRILTVHRAKGLEFPVVVMTGLGSKPHRTTSSALADRMRGQLQLYVKDRFEEKWQTAGFADADGWEKDLATAEAVRLNYVAATRARDHLLIGLHTAAKGEPAALQFAATADELGEVVQHLDFSEPEEFVRRVVPQPEGAMETADEVRAREEAWLAARDSVLAAARATTYRTATGLRREAAGDDDAASADSGGATRWSEQRRPGRGGGTSVGRAVHAVLQVVDLATGADVEQLATGAATAEGVPDRAGDVARMVGVALASEPVRRAAASGRTWREVPLGAASEDGTVLEGFVDLLFEGPEGYEVIDYKTDSVTEIEVAERMEGYRAQGEAYRDLVARLTGRPPAAVHFVFLATGSVATIGDAGKPR